VKSKTAPKLSLDSVEWDFRRVKEHRLPVVIEWEYARSSPQIVKAVADYRKALWEFEDLRPALGRIPPHLQKLTQGEIFPAPWTALSSFSKAVCPLVLQEIEDGDCLTDEGKASGAIVQFYIRFDRGPLKQLTKEFGEWASQKAKEYAAKHGPRPTGKPALPQWHLLRELAAYRIQESERGRLTFNQIKEAIAAYESQSRVSHAGVLPNYNGKDEWSRAVKKARERIARVGLVQ
jgi:hypothetical protein